MQVFAQLILKVKFGYFEALKSNEICENNSRHNFFSIEIFL